MTTMVMTLTMTTKDYHDPYIEGKDVLKDNPMDLYDTPVDLVRGALDVFKQWHYKKHEAYFYPSIVIDPGAGSGIWGQLVKKMFVSPTGQIPAPMGVDLRELERPRGFQWWYPNTDFLKWEPAMNGKVAFVCGNPPYGVSGGKRNRKLAEQFIRHSLDLCCSGGYVYFLLKSVFTEGIDRGKGLFSLTPPVAIFQSIRRIPWRPDEHGNRSNKVAYSMFLWQKNVRHMRTEFYWFDWKDGKGVLI